MLRSDVLLWEPYKMNKFAVVFAAAGLMALAACGEKPAETTNTSNEVVENVVENAAVVMENTADNATSNVAENRSEEHTSELQSLIRNSYSVCCLKKKRKNTYTT